jgi:C1A family cysteine protease
MMLDLAELQAELARAGNPWRAAQNPIFELVASGEGNVFGLSITEEERANLLTRAEQLEQDSGLLAAAEPPPPSADWRSSGWVTPARSQGATCQSCVAFATCGALESRLRIFAGNASMDIDLSEAHLFACGCPGGCANGWNFQPALERAKEPGIGRESDFPYEGTDQTCKEIPVVVRVSGWTTATTDDVRKHVIAANGPVIGGMRVFEDLSAYSGGVYRQVIGNQVGLHAVCIVGYDDNGGYWIVKNSWGPKWGEEGFLRISYGQCGLDQDFPFFDVDVDGIPST